MNWIADLFRMTDRVWERHANPWSGWTRMPVLPCLCAIIFYRQDLGWSLWPLLGVIIAWTFFNPRAFSPPSSTNNWMSKAVFGERVWLAQSKVPIPIHHAVAARLLSVLPLLGIAPMIYGLIVLDPWATILGCMVTVLFKLWFLDRMVWLYEDMASMHEPYEAWLK